MNTVNKEKELNFQIDMMFYLTPSMATQPKKSSLLKINFILLSQIFYLDFQTLE